MKADELRFFLGDRVIIKKGAKRDIEGTVMAIDPTALLPYKVKTDASTGLLGYRAYELEYARKSSNALIVIPSPNSRGFGYQSGVPSNGTSPSTERTPTPEELGEIEAPRPSSASDDDKGLVGEVGGGSQDSGVICF